MPSWRRFTRPIAIKMFDGVRMLGEADEDDLVRIKYRHHVNGTSLPIFIAVWRYGQMVWWIGKKDGDPYISYWDGGIGSRIRDQRTHRSSISECEGWSDNDIAIATEIYDNLCRNFPR